MINFTLKSAGLFDQKGDKESAKKSVKKSAKKSAKKIDCYVVFLEQDFKIAKKTQDKNLQEQDKILQDIEKKYLPNLEKFFELKNFKGEEKSSLLIHAFDKQEIFHVLFLGLGKASGNGTIDIENFRRALGVLMRVAEKNKFKKIVVNLPDSSLFGVTEEFFAKQIGTMLTIASYHFDCFITQEACKLPQDYDITLLVPEFAQKPVPKLASKLAQNQETSASKSSIANLKNSMANLQKGLQEGEIIGQAVNKARHAIDMPAVHMHPQELADFARQIAKENKLKITVFDEKDVIKMGMGGLEAVSKGSDRDCALVIMEYQADKSGVIGKDSLIATLRLTQGERGRDRQDEGGKLVSDKVPTLAFVGKGITFDSGGLSLKPANSMETMKEDMSGAAAVIAAIGALAKLKPDVNIIAVAPISENLPSGKATKPGDIIKFYNGKTAEVKNTDAEGRLILADALSYVEKHYKPDAIIDLATLTGACQYALGHFYCGMMSKDADLIAAVQRASDLSGDRVWNLPFHDDYKAAIKSTVADISNTGSPKYMAGTVTAGFFLKNFVEHTPWLHLDIAGTAFDVPDMPYYRDGATGFGVRLLVELAMAWKK